MANSILNDTKKMLGLESDYTAFDTDIITHINTAFFNLQQLGIGPTDGYLIEGETETWSDVIGTSKKLAAVKSYVYLKVRMLFDPPTLSTVIEAMNRQVTEMEWRLRTQAEADLVIPEVVNDDSV